MRTILPLDATDVHEPKVDLVDKCRGLEQMVGVLPSHLAFRQSPQLVVDDSAAVSEPRPRRRIANQAATL
jgi:hypothetical protein